MESTKRKLLRHIPEKTTYSLIEKHTYGVIFNQAKQAITFLMDKRYSLNSLRSGSHIRSLIEGIEKAFGEEVNMMFRLANPHHERDGKVLVPIGIRK